MPESCARFQPGMPEIGQACKFDCALQAVQAGFGAAVADLEKRSRRREWGQGQTVAILDSGVDAHHRDLCGRILAAVDCTKDPPGDYQTDVYGHGTFVSGMICANGATQQVLGLAPGARINAVKVVDDAGRSDYGRLTLGLEWALDSQASVVCIALGSMLPPPSRCVRLLDKLLSDGRLVLAATIAAPAVLQPFVRRPVMYPAALQGVLAVTEGIGDGYSGPRPELWIPRLSALSTLPGNQYGWRRGPSVAVAITAGLAAALLSLPEATPTSVFNICLKGA